LFCFYVVFTIRLLLIPDIKDRFSNIKITFTTRICNKIQNTQLKCKLVRHYVSSLSIRCLRSSGQSSPTGFVGLRSLTCIIHHLPESVSFTKLGCLSFTNSWTRLPYRHQVPFSFTSPCVHGSTDPSRSPIQVPL